MGESRDARELYGVLFGPWPAITNRTLSAERNRLLGSFVVLAAVSFALGALFHFRLPWDRVGGYGPFLFVGAKLLYAYFVYRVSRFLQHPRWMTAIYVALTPIAGFELIPLVGLLVSIRMTRGGLDENV